MVGVVVSVGFPSVVGSALTGATSLGLFFFFHSSKSTGISPLSLAHS